MAIKTRLKVMIFLQFFIWGAWLVTLGSYMINTLHFSGAQVGMVYSSKGIAALIMPSLAGIIADRWIKANRLYGLCHLLGAVALYYAAQVDQPMVMFWVMLFNAMVYMPTMALSNAISYFCLEKHGFDTVKDFPPVRVYGTVGFILAMWLISFSRIELSNMQLYLASAVSLLLAVYSLTLPNCPTNKVKRSQSWVSMLGLDAFVLFKQKRMAVFFLFAMLLGRRCKSPIPSATRSCTISLLTRCIRTASAYAILRCCSPCRKSLRCFSSSPSRSSCVDTASSR
ncbi:Nucleoside-transport system protein nupG [Serratia fonticola]|uniref:Nucleoside-transport system protein nupG n=1 Tax=Serratia fonticola TaxID=47917 RepID=A0A4U9W6L6_SERFO|nr:Nucleoside-transport system protein nupG [Serratia fonticola]